MTEYKLIYFDIRGLGEPIRLLFTLAGVPFEDVRLPYTPGIPGVLPEETKKIAPFGQVPLLQFDGNLLSQSGAIGRFLAKKFNLHGANELESAKIDEIIDAIKDYADGLRAIFSAPDAEGQKKAQENVVQVLKPKYGHKLNQLLEESESGFFVGESPTLADLVFYNFIAQVAVVGGGDLPKEFPEIGEFVKKFEEIPQLKSYLETRPNHPW